MAEEHADRRPAGELEASVLAALWAAGEPLTPGAVQHELGGGLARTTVTTILSRLRAKGLVTRRRSGRGYAYAPDQEAPAVTARRMHAELLRGGDHGGVLARFVSELSDEDERTLRALLEEDADADRAGAAREGGTRVPGDTRAPGGVRVPETPEGEDRR